MDFYIVDVFAEEKYQGNQLAVLIPTRAISTEEMQKIAREINFSETTFILSDKQDNGGYDVRIFTPDVEIPFAGHPTLGTAFIIQKVLENNESKQITLNLEVGQIPVTIEGEQLIMKQNPPELGEVLLNQDIIFEMLQISTEDMDSRFPIQIVSTGLPAVIVPLRSLEAVNRCRIHHDRYQNFINTVIKANILVFAAETERKENDLSVRVFLDDPGFPEDPATGSANGNLAGYLVTHNYLDSKNIAYRVEQGFQMRRPSILTIQAEQHQNSIKILVGGKVFLIAKGKWY
ncbi:PhzF family phenazine biosynthesis protein [Saccharibacillus kuerlensis]|uniref:Phenazine biosynthesis protein n=1 Tax=Saccharibacillus kuerlensis TaxID=459527 RepID=A0ABQ2L020_9BACL|nr:PhzF family phenazine biosynthesis protein [Saccharibacillus kuerlensis]GGN98201.1 phenazine biosynthesis protein [Saccharibacillus kuerlensis]